MQRAGQALHHSHCRAHCAYDDCSNNGELLVFEPDFQVVACICQQFMMLFKVSHLKILWTLLSAISSRQPSLRAIAFQHMTCSKITQKIYSFWQGVSRAYSFWLVLNAHGNQMELFPLGTNLKYPEHMPFGQCSAQMVVSPCKTTRRTFQ